MKEFLKEAVRLVYPDHCPVCQHIVCSRQPDSHICDFCRQALSYIKEPYCMKCGKPIWSEREYCPDCTSRRHNFISGRSVFSYQGAIRESLTRYKYENKREYTEFYAEEFYKRLGPWGEGSPYRADHSRTFASKEATHAWL